MSDEPTTTEPEQQQAKSQLPATIGAVALVEERGYIAPTNAQEAYELARLLSVVAGSSFDGNTSKIATAILAGQEAGLPPVYSVMNIAIINGRPSMWGDALMALVQASGKLEDFQSRQIGTSFDLNSTAREQWPDDFGFSVMMKRKGQATPYTGTFTVGDAKRAGLWMDTRRKPWFEHPLVMLERRAMSKPTRKGFADVLAGLSFREEVEDYEPVTPKIDTAALASDEPDIETVEAEPSE
jgi:hypothetical protein